MIDLKRIALGLGCGLLLTIGVGEAAGAPRALIVTGLSGSAENTEEFHRLAAETQRLLHDRGIAEIEVLRDKVTRQAILEALDRHKAVDDELWLILFGHAGRAQGGVPAFQVSGPRLTAPDLKAALDAIPGRQFVLIGTSFSSPFLPLLQNARRTVVSATRSEGQADQPLFPAAWVDALKENPRAEFPALAARAADLVKRHYEESGLAQIEHARLADPVTGRILEPPFGADHTAPSAPPPVAAAGRPESSAAADIIVKIDDPASSWENRPPTAEAKDLIAAARAASNPDGHGALVLAQKIGFTVQDDRTTEARVFIRVFLVREDAVERWANQQFPQGPAMTSKLELARVIQPDGSSIVLNPAKQPTANDGFTGPATVFLPQTRAGCIVEFGYRTRRLLDAAVPEVFESLDIQREVPVLSTAIEIRVPEKQHFRVALKNSAAKPAETSENDRRVYRWTLAGLPAAEPLPGDPPRSLWTTWLGISSLRSWDDFAAWYRRITKGVDAVDDTVRKTAAALTADAPTREAKIRRLFEFVSALRYVTVPIGVGAVRPHTPAQVLTNRYGDCKDKANLLVALLRLTGIDAEFALVNRNEATDVSFPSWQFNHAVCLVPGKDDAEDLWLDATDSVTPFGYVPPGDAGRQAFVIGADKAEFKTISTGRSPGGLHDHWELRESAAGGWEGSFRRTATGLAEYGLRRQFRGLGPARRCELVSRIVAEAWPGSEPADAAVTDVSTLGEAVAVEARASGPGAFLPRAVFGWMDDVGSPHRDRPLWLNDSQPFTGTQTVRLLYQERAPALPAEPFRREAAGQVFTVMWTKIDDHTVERVARIELAEPRVAADAYPALRDALRAWTAATAR